MALDPKNLGFQLLKLQPLRNTMALILWLRYAYVNLQFGDMAKLGRQPEIHLEVNKDQASLLKHPIVKIANCPYLEAVFLISQHIQDEY